MKPSVLTRHQVKVYGWKPFICERSQFRIQAEVRHDDACGNGHNTFSITGVIQRVVRGSWRDEMCGCIHDLIVKHFPELAPYIKWHLCSTDGPMHYIANAVFNAGDRDHWGLRKGEFGPINAKDGTSLWEPEIPEQMANVWTRAVAAVECPPPVTITYKRYGRIGGGKERDLNAARHAAIWPEATDEELMQEPEKLKAALEARLPKLLEDFQAAVESLGLVY